MKLGIQQSSAPMSIRRTIVLGCVLTLSLIKPAFSQFEKANREYAAGHFKEAIDEYETAVRVRPLSANLFYDLGNAYFHSGDLGRAILNYERALKLDRRHPEAQVNLQIARDEARALEITPTSMERLARFASANQYAVTAAAAFWVASFCFAWWLLGRRRSSRLIGLAVVATGIVIAAVLGVVGLENGNRGKGFAVITDKDVKARLATADTARTVLALPAGSEVKLLSERGDWSYVSLPNNLRGWVPSKSVTPVRL